MLSEVTLKKKRSGAQIFGDESRIKGESSVWENHLFARKKDGPILPKMRDWRGIRFCITAANITSAEHQAASKCQPSSVRSSLLLKKLCPAAQNM